MPDFNVSAFVSPASAVEARVWSDPASTTRPSRVVPINDRQHRFLRLPPNSLLRLVAILVDQSAPQADSVVGRFTAWPIEYPATGGLPAVSYPIAGTSAVAEFRLVAIGHYLVAMRHEDTQDAPSAVAGGVVLVHCDVTGS